LNGFTIASIFFIQASTMAPVSAEPSYAGGVPARIGAKKPFAANALSSETNTP
jgi:hypothetical protein